MVIRVRVSVGFQFSVVIGAWVTVVGVWMQKFPHEAYDVNGVGHLA